MTKISDLPRDLVEEVLSRVPVTSLRAMRFTCTKWNTFSKGQNFTNKQIAQAKIAAEKKQIMENMVIMNMNDRVYLISFNLHGLHKNENVESPVQPIGMLNSLDFGDKFVEKGVMHCDGLLLCILNNTFSRLVVWNPYCGQIRWVFKPKNSFLGKAHYALGYEIKNKSHRCYKILRFMYTYAPNRKTCDEFEIYNFDSNSWKAVKFTPDWTINSFQCGAVTLKGNSYWSAAQDTSQGELRELFVLSFDFTTERYGPRLPLPCKSFGGHNVILSSVREENLAVLFQSMRCTEIWISNKIESNAVSWASKLYLKSYMTFPRCPESYAVSFLVDEENKIAVVL